MKKFFLFALCVLLSGPALALEGFNINPVSSIGRGGKMDRNKPIKVRLAGDVTGRHLLSGLIEAALREQGYAIADENIPAEARLIIEMTVSINNRKNMEFTEFFRTQNLSELETPDRGKYAGTDTRVFTTVGHTVAGYLPVFGSILLSVLTDAGSGVMNDVGASKHASQYGQPIKPCEGWRCSKAYKVTTFAKISLWELDKETREWKEAAETQGKYRWYKFFFVPYLKEGVFLSATAKGSGKFDAVPLLGILEAHLQKFAESLE
ncbi:MAG: hypothetical protein LBI31_01275, partial [Zoogloeaceae bacterium]|nr:hypothetical protein [Zoogloeaceae bacterium]